MGCGTGRIPSATPSSSHWGDLSSEVTKSGWRVGIVAAFHPSRGVQLGPGRTDGSPSGGSADLAARARFRNLPPCSTRSTTHLAVRSQL